MQKARKVRGANIEKSKPIAKAYPAHCCMNCKWAKNIEGEEVECDKIVGETYLNYVCRLFRFKF